MFKSERGAIEVSGTLLAIIVAVILLTIPTLIHLANTQDNIEQMDIQAELDRVINEIANKGEFTEEEYEKFVEQISNPNTYDVEIEIKRLNENIAKKTIQINSGSVGESTNSYTTEYTSQVLQQIRDLGKIVLNEGDIVTITITSTNQTISTQLTNVDNVIKATSTVTVNKSGK